MQTLLFPGNNDFPLYGVVTKAKMSITTKMMMMKWTTEAASTEEEFPLKKGLYSIL